MGEPAHWLTQKKKQSISQTFSKNTFRHLLSPSFLCSLPKLNSPMQIDVMKKSDRLKALDVPVRMLSGSRMRYGQ